MSSLASVNRYRLALGIVYGDTEMVIIQVLYIYMATFIPDIYREFWLVHLGNTFPVYTK